VATLVGQRVFEIALGYEDLNDNDELRHDPMMAVLAGKLEAGREKCAPPSAEEGHRHCGAPAGDVLTADEARRMAQEFAKLPEPKVPEFLGTPVGLGERGRRGLASDQSGDGQQRQEVRHHDQQGIGNSDPHGRKLELHRRGGTEEQAREYGA
jgi:hypothetical protein